MICCLETPKRVIGKQCIPWSDAAECSIWPGFPLFANSLAVFSMGISKWHSLIYLKLKLDSSNTRGVHLIVSLMAHHTAWLYRARGNCSDFTGEWFSTIGWNFGLLRSVFQKLLKVQVGSVIYIQPLLYAKWKTKQALRGLCLIHDNAPAHKCVLIKDFLKEGKVVQLSHPPYSPDLSPCNSLAHLSQRLKVSLRWAFVTAWCPSSIVHRPYSIVRLSTIYLKDISY